MKTFGNTTKKVVCLQCNNLTTSKKIKIMQELIGVYGSGETEATIYEYKGWYVCHGSVNVNRTHEELTEGINIEYIEDIDCFTWSKDIESLEELIEAVEA